MGSASTLIQTVSPTVARPLVDIGVNKNFFGAPIVPEQKYGPAKAKSHRAFRSTSEQSQRITKALNEITGGTRYQPGYIDIPPDLIDYVVEYAGGGAGRTVNQVVSLGGKLASKKDIPVREIPFARRFMGELDERQDMQAFYDNVEKLGAIKADAKYLKDTNPKKFKEFRAKNRAALGFVTTIGDTKSGVSTMQADIETIRTRIKNRTKRGLDTTRDEELLLRRMKSFNARMKKLFKEAQ